jgi:hypothetical protein
MATASKSNRLKESRAGKCRRFYLHGGEARMALKKEIAPELVAEAKRLYEQTLAPVDDIAAMMDVSRPSFYRIAKAEGWRNRRATVGTFAFARALTGATVTVIAPAPAPAEQPRGETIANSDPVSPQQRAAITQRIMGAVERELDAIERIVEKIAPGDQIEAEHGARTTASIARTLRELAALNQPDKVTPPDETDDDPLPRDIDEFREALTRRIEAFIDAEQRGEGETSAEFA